MNNWEVFRKGSADERDYAVDGVPTTDGVEIVEAYLAIKRSLSDPDGEAVAFLAISGGEGDAGVVSDNGLGDGSGTLRFVLGERALDACDPRITYFRTIKVRLSDGRYSCPRQGAIAPVRIVAAGIERAGDAVVPPAGASSLGLRLLTGGLCG